MESSSTPIVKGDLRTLIRVSTPIMFFLFCEALTTFVERIFLSYYSMESVQGSLNANYLASIFQSPSVAIAAMAQVFVGFYQGSNQNERVGPCVWQLIWFSFLSLMITVPLSSLVSAMYFKDTSIELGGVPYFNILSWGNFLFPLNTALAAFYLGRGKILFVTILTLASYALQVFLSWLLIFGIGQWIPSLGAQGAAIAKCISLGLLCCFLLSAFLGRKNRETYQTSCWRFSPVALWHYMSPGLVRALGYLSSKACWVCTCYIMVKKGGLYLDVLTIGGTLITFLVFTTNGLYKAILTIASNLIGAAKNTEIWRLCRSFIIYTSVIGALLTIPLAFFPQTLIYFFDARSKVIFEKTFQQIHHWIWLYMFALTLQMSFCALLVTLRELKYQLYCYLFLWPAFVMLVYVCIVLGGWEADKMWLIMVFESVVAAIFFFARLYPSWLKIGVLSRVKAPRIPES